MERAVVMPMNEKQAGDFIQEDLEKVVGDKELRGLDSSTVTITGASGFMGIWLTELLLYMSRTQKVKLKLNLLASNFDFARKSAPHLYETESDVTLIGGDIKAIHELPQDTQWLIHAAASPDVRIHNSQPIHASQTITQGTYSVLDCATRLSDLRGILNISSGYVYGFRSSEALIGEGAFEGFDPAIFGAGYAEAKRYAESLCTIFRNQFRLPIVNVRPFSFVGPYQPADAPWAINNFIQDVVQSQPIRVQGDGSAVRSYMYGADMAWWLLNMLLRGEAGRSYNLGSDDGVTLKQLAEKISGFSSGASHVNYSRAALHSKASSFVPSVQAAQKDLGLSLCFGLDEALSRTYQWYSK